MRFQESWNKQIWTKHYEWVEGRVNHFYLDGEDVVTLGVGHAVFEPGQLKMVLRDTLVPATMPQVYDDFRNIKMQPSGKLASYYGPLCKTIMQDPEIDKLFLADLEGALERFEQSIIPLTGYPEQAALAAIDMEFNLGEGGLKTKFPKWVNAFREKNWHVCALECLRKQRPEYPNGVSKERNEWTQDMFWSLDKMV